MKKTILILLALITLVSCGSKKSVELQPSVTKESVRIEKQTLRDTIVKTVSDSAFYKAYIECKEGVPVITHSEKDNGKNIQQEISLNGNWFQVKSKKSPEEISIPIKDIRVETNEKEVIKVPYPVEVPVEVPKPLTWWQKLWIKIGQWTTVALGIYFLTKIPWSRLRRLLGL